MTIKSINYEEYVFCLCRIAYWLLTHNNTNKQFKTRDIYAYENNVMTKQEVADTIVERGRNVILDNKAFIIAEFVECAIYDNKDHSFLPNYVTCSDGKTKIYKDQYTQMANYVSNYEVTNGKSPDKIYIPNLDPTPRTDLHQYITQQGGGKLGQKTGYSCGPHSLMQSIYRLTGIELSESELMGVCGTTTSGTGHDGLATGLAWFNRKYGYNLKMAWKNFSEVGFDGLQNAYENGAVFLHLCYRSTWGHYEVPLTSSTDPNKILNSLGNQCGNGYCGYIESRSKSTQQSYINGISQKSVCIITR